MNRHWEGVNEELHETHPVRSSVPPSPEVSAKTGAGREKGDGRGWETDKGVAADVLRKKLSSHLSVPDNRGQPGTLAANGHAHPSAQARRPSHSAHEEVDSESEDEEHVPEHVPSRHEHELSIMRKVLRKWWRVAGLQGHPGIGHEEEGEFTVAWTKGIAPRTEGRIRIGRKVV